MPYIQVDLDAIPRFSLVESAAALPVDAAYAGMIRLWEWCWREKRERVDAIHLAAFFRSGDGARVGAALVAFGFAEELEQGKFRVRGAAKYLRISEAQSAAAKRTNEQRWGDRSSEQNTGQSTDPSTNRSTVALSASIEQRSAISSSSSAGSPPAFLEADPASDRHDNQQQDGPAAGSPPAAADQPPLPGAREQARASAQVAVLLQRLWNELTAPPIARWTTITEKRRAAAKARWSENPSEGYWREVIGRIARSPFCRGENERTWVADPDFLLKAETGTRALEGKYDARAKTTASALKELSAEDTKALYD